MRTVLTAAKAAKWVATIWIFDFDDIGTQIRQQHAC
jgi:hypothetical protein